jgi:hypothetical protein
MPELGHFLARTLDRQFDAEQALIKPTLNLGWR